MSIEDITKKIILDAEEDEKRALEAAEQSAQKIILGAEERIAAAEKETKAQVEAKNKSFAAGVEATARLESAKISLAAKRKVLDGVYENALTRLKKADVRDILTLSEKLLLKYAEEGDEIVFADGFPCIKEVSALSVVKERGLKLSFERANIEGGFILKGKNADKDLSYKTLLEQDRAENETEIANKLFNE